MPMLILKFKADRDDGTLTITLALCPYYIDTFAVMDLMGSFSEGYIMQLLRTTERPLQGFRDRVGF